ncbi:hypothetical protein Bbelb_068070 [Branchiostoma belcheri]|nr:hypothetical protein Bbelb_068070 [Branchiostoma belcheri]
MPTVMVTFRLRLRPDVFFSPGPGESARRWNLEAADAALHVPRSLGEPGTTGNPRGTTRRTYNCVLSTGEHCFRTESNELGSTQTRRITFSAFGLRIHPSYGPVWATRVPCD